jgi:hypothetical protein
MNFLKYFKQHANLNRDAMETRDHFKNGANPKSQTSKKNNVMSDKGADRKFFRERKFIYGIFVFLTLSIIFPNNLLGQIDIPDNWGWDDDVVTSAILANIKKPTNSQGINQGGTNQSEINHFGPGNGKSFAPPNNPGEQTERAITEFEQKKESMNYIYEKKSPKTGNKDFNNAYDLQQENYITRSNGTPLVVNNGRSKTADVPLNKNRGRAGALGGSNIRGAVARGSGLGTGQMWQGLQPYDHTNVRPNSNDKEKMTGFTNQTKKEAKNIIENGQYPPITIPTKTPDKMQVDNIFKKDKNGETRYDKLLSKLRKEKDDEGVKKLEMEKGKLDYAKNNKNVDKNGKSCASYQCKSESNERIKTAMKSFISAFNEYENRPKQKK